MDLAFIIAAAIVGGIIIGVTVEHFFFKKDETQDESAIIQNLTDKVDLIINDIKKTV